MKKILWLIPFILIFSIIFISALNISIDIQEKYTKVSAGEKFYFEVEVKYPENSVRKDLIFEFNVKKNDEIVTHSKVLKAVETQISFLESVDIPEDAKEGLYTLYISVSDYNDLYEEVSADFQITKQKENHKYLWIAIGILFFLIMIILIWSKLK